MASESIDLVSETTAQHLVDAADSILDQLDGTAATYKLIMRRWFLRRGCNALTSTGLTALVDLWYELTRDNWCGYTEFYQPDVSAVTYGTKGGDNAELTCTPSTDTVANQDDYAGLPLFACTDCNWEVDAETLRPVITAIDGISSGFKRNDPTKYVGVLQMAGYVFIKEGTDSYIVGYAANRNVPYANVMPLPDAVNPDDNSVRSWVVHAKYPSHTYNGLMTACAGFIPTAFMSHNSLHTLSKKNGSQYSGTTTADNTFMLLMMYIKYGLTLDGIMQGCCNNNYQYPAQVAEEGVMRVLISTSHRLEVGMGVLIGNYSSSTDRGSLYSITGQAGAIITKIETVTVDGTDYAAIYVEDMDDSFDTAANGAATSGTTYISTFHWPTGTTDGVLGNDGSPVSNTSGKYPAKLQGIEFMNGAYEITADVILSLEQDAVDEDVYYYKPYVVQASANQSTAITSNYKATGHVLEQPSSDGWNYIKKLGLSLGVMFPTMIGGSSSTYTRDAIYMNAKVEGTREMLLRGALYSGVGFAGLSCVNGGIALSYATWTLAARLSASGNRGEWAA